jgi:hypothetical protein
MRQAARQSGLRAERALPLIGEGLAMAQEGGSIFLTPSSIVCAATFC